MEADGERIDSRLQKLADESDIRSVLALYCRAVDHLDYDSLRGVYHPDATDDHAPFFSGGVDAFIDYMRESSTRPLLLTRHSISGTYIELDGPLASSESYFEALHVRVVDGTATDERLFGRYLDKWERRDDVWRIAARRVVWDWSSSAPSAQSHVGVGIDKGTVGCRSTQDESYGWFGRGLPPN